MRLDELGVTGTDRAAVLGQTARLGALDIPASLGAELRSRLAVAVDEAFVDGYRRVIFGTAALAAMASLAAFGLIRHPERPD